MKVTDNINYLLLKEDYSGAIAEIKKCLQTDSLNTTLIFKLGLAYQKSLQFGRAVTSYTKVLHLKPGDTDATSLLGQCYLEFGQINMAYPLFKDLFEKDSNNVKNGLQYAGILVERNKYPEALAVYRTLLSRDSSNGYIYREIGHCYYLMDSLGTAGKYYELSLKRNKLDNIALQQFVNICLKTHRGKRAIDLLSVYVYKYPTDAFYHKLLADSYFEAKIYDYASSSYTKAVFYGDSSAYVYQKLGISQYSYANQLDSIKASQKMKNYTFAIKALQAALSKDSSAITFYFLASANQKIGNYEKSVGLFRKAIELIMPGVLPDIYLRLSESLLNLKEYDKVIDIYETVLKLRPNYSELLYKIGHIYENIYHNKANAAKYYKEYMKCKDIGSESISEKPD
ncbi:MAG: tetratricopeptide repeat protein [Ignavibacteria bacterium]|jgi:tetratricopeptide (TPR) repeat protein|nr:tetratricopeptide repeat protein [Ignavibacteria bacterium]MCU7502961.1 tetratricopeptide repeat protein [Ignavibacteria bacterium]MCU7517056.1 tetratricopeptide repeat protein [Ignavibacteria bacterium]